MSLDTWHRYKQKFLHYFVDSIQVGWRIRIITETVYNKSTGWITVSSFFVFDRSGLYGGGKKGKKMTMKRTRIRN